MSEDMGAYGEPQKRQARAAVLQHAVGSLTDGRASSPLVTVKTFNRLLQYCTQHIHEFAKRDLSEPLAEVQDHWNQLHASRVGRRRPRDLKVLFLCGPEPLNDLQELGALGIPPENVWAVEGEQEAFRSAARQLREARLPIKLHFGSLHEFFKIVPEQFDIVYFDACGPLLGGRPKTNIVLRELFLNQRMAPLSALITNFASTPRDNEKQWIDRLFAWYAPRYLQPVWNDNEEVGIGERVNEGSEYREHLGENLEQFYSDFVSRFTIEFANELLPWWRVRALSAARRAYYAQESQLQAAVEAAFAVAETADTVEAFIHSTGHGQLSPDSYPFLWMANLAREHLEANDPLREFVFNDRLAGVSLYDAIAAISLVRNYFEGDIDWAKHNWDACSGELREALGRFRWFDSVGAPLYRLFCDRPLPNLVVDLLVGVYGYPYHVNLLKLRRLQYCAKKTTMLSDVFILDQCRYLYDMVPTLPLFGEELPFHLQLPIRICMSLIRRHTHESCWDLFWGSALAGTEVKGFSVHSWPAREILE
jgi:hypothetical protein